VVIKLSVPVDLKEFDYEFLSDLEVVLVINANDSKVHTIKFPESSKQCVLDALARVCGAVY
jgi:hypothetical protein